MRGCLKLMGFLTGVLFVTTAVPILLVVNLADVVTDRELVKELAAQTQPLLLAAAPQIAAEMLQAEAQEQGLPPIPVETAVLEEALQTVMPPDWMSTQMDTAVNAVFDGLEADEAAGIAIELDGSQLLTRARGEPGRQAIANVVESLPPCSETGAGTAVTMRGVALPDCLPPDVNAAEAVQTVHNLLVETLDQNPQLEAAAQQIRVPLLTVEQASPEALAQFERLRRIFQLAQRWAGVLWLLPVGLLLLILLLAVRSPAEWGVWWGWPLLLTAVLALLAAWSVPFVVMGWGRTAVSLPQDTADIAGLMSTVIRQSIQSLLGLWQRRVYWQAGGMLLVSLFLLAVGLLGTRRERTSYKL